MKRLEVPVRARTLAADALRRRARYHRRRGGHHQALLALRDACNLSMDDPRLWSEYAAACAKVHHLEDAHRALGMARWLRGRAADEPVVVGDELFVQGAVRATRTSEHAA